MSASAYISACFDLLFDVLKHADNILVFLPFASLVICFVFTLVFRMIRGKYYAIRVSCSCLVVQRLRVLY